ncbi:MAG: hypothetical protein JWR55_3109 [Aeromicrobium sp.]|nr:hypothetical protein [Aeromicrobium sp.]
MILAAAVCPHPPLLVPAVAPGTTGELADLRAACDAAVQTLLGARPDRILVVAGGDLDHEPDETAGGTLAAYGADAHAGGAGTGLPLGHTIGAWLLDRAGWSGSRTYALTGAADVSGDVALLVMADGTTKRSVQAPGFLDDRAAAYDAAIAAALAAGDPDALLALDPVLGAELGSTGVPALRSLGQVMKDEMTKGAVVTARLHVDEAPFGVGYFVADWVLAGR